MSEQINKVLASTAQAFSTAEQKQARDNISAQAKITYSYSAGSNFITAIDGSGVGNPLALTTVAHDGNLSGLGTLESLLGLHDPVTFTSQRSASDPISSMKLAYSGLRFEVPSAWTAEHSLTNSKIGYEWPSALDTENHLGWYSHSLLDGRSMSLSAHDCSYIKCNVITATTVDSPYLGIYGGYGSGYNQTSIVAAVSDQNRPDPYIAFNASGSSELVDMSSIRRWNAKQDASGMSAFVPYSSVKADSDSAVTSINGSSVGKFTGVSSNNNITGNGLSSSPVGLKVPVFMSDNSVSAEYGINGVYMSATPYTSTHYNVGGWNIHSTGNATHHRSVGADVSGIEINWDTDFYVMKLSASGLVTMDSWSPSYHRAEFNYDGAIESANNGKSSTWDASALKFADSASATQVVDASSIVRWNSYSSLTSSPWSESANSLGTGFGGNAAVSASQYNYGNAHANWACREVYADGIPAMHLYGFQSPPSDSGKTYAVQGNGHFTPLPQQNYFVYLFHQTGESMEVMDSSFYPTGLTADARLDFVNLCSGCSANIKTDTFHGNTADINPGESATMWYIANADIWTDGVNPVPV